MNAEYKAQATEEQFEPSTPEDLEKLLAFAEKLQANYEESRERGTRFRLTAFMFATMLLAGSILYIVTSDVSNFRSLAESIGFAGVLLASVMFVFGIVLAEPYLARSRREQRALNEVIQLIRETESAIATKGQSSALQRAQFRIRLSRFDIGTGSSDSWRER